MKEKMMMKRYVRACSVSVLLIEQIYFYWSIFGFPIPKLLSQSSMLLIIASATFSFNLPLVLIASRCVFYVEENNSISNHLPQDYAYEKILLKLISECECYRKWFIDFYHADIAAK